MLRSVEMNNFVLLAVAGLIACGDNIPAVDAPGGGAKKDASVDASIDASIDAPIDGLAAFVLSSSAMVDGAEIPALYTCRGRNISPPLSWTGGPNAAAYAVFFTDTTNGLTHSGIWDITPNISALPEDIEKVSQPFFPGGSKQPLAYDLFTYGYLGPCPGYSQNDVYRFTVYAVDEYPLRGVTPQTSRQEVRRAVMQHVIAEAFLSGTFPPPPAP
jgi:Raf kinase inhibitor-like YbhB/YbcL family protein